MDTSVNYTHRYKDIETENNLQEAAERYEDLIRLSKLQDFDSREGELLR